MMKILLVGVLLLSVVFINPSLSQELNCRVVVNLEGIPSTNRDLLKNFQQDVERYLNSNRYTDEDMSGEKIDCALTIFFKNVTGDNRYAVQLVVTSQRPVYAGNDKTDKSTPVLRIMDDNCEFIYLPGQRMLQDDFSFDPLTDLLDYYAYIIIGFDLETYTPMEGSKCFRKALGICNQAGASAFSSIWQLSSAPYSRYGLADELNNSKYDAARIAFNSYYFDGIDMLDLDPKKAQENMLKAIETFQQVRRTQNPLSVYVKQFFDAKYKEIADSFLSYPDRSVYDRLGGFDQEHLSTYQDYKRKPQ